MMVTYFHISEEFPPVHLSRAQAEWLNVTLTYSPLTNLTGSKRVNALDDDSAACMSSCFITR